MSFKGNRDREALCPNSWEPMEIIVFELAKALKVPRSLPADNLQAADFQVLDGHIACNQCRAKSLGVSRNHDVKDTCAPSKPLGSNTNTGMGLSGLFIKAFLF